LLDNVRTSVTKYHNTFGTSQALILFSTINSMASKLLATLIQGNAKFAQTYTSPPPLMKMREMWKKEGIKGATIHTH
jgi:hypothetical protein